MRILFYFFTFSTNLYRFIFPSICNIFLEGGFISAFTIGTSVIIFCVACLFKGYSKIVTTLLWFLVLRSILCFLWIFLLISTTVFLLCLRISTFVPLLFITYNNSLNMILLIFGFLMLGLTYTLILF
jgi:hypothetical protein